MENNAHFEQLILQCLLKNLHVCFKEMCKVIKYLYFPLIVYTLVGGAEFQSKR